MSADTTTTPAPLRPSLLILIAVSMINPLGINIYLPSMPSMSAVFQTSIANVQLTLSLYLFAVAVAQIVIGPLSDRMGRRPVMLWGLLLFVFASIGCVFAPNIETLIGMRVVQAFGGCAGIVLGRAVIRDMHAGDEAASMIGYTTMGLAVAPMVAPWIGGHLHAWFGWQGAFAAMAAVTAVVLVFAYFLLHETHHERGKAESATTILKNFAILSRSQEFWAYSLTATFASGIFFAFLGSAAFVSAGVLKLEPEVYGGYFAFVAVGYIIGNFFSGRYTTRFGLNRMMVSGTALLLASVGLAIGLFWAFPPSTLNFFLPMGLMGMANGIVLPSSLSGATGARPDMIGAASGLSGSLQLGVGSLLSYLAGSAYTDLDADITVWPLLYWMLACAAPALVFARWAMHINRKKRGVIRGG